jgi:predicted nucleic acid-binding protein
MRCVFLTMPEFFSRSTVTGQADAIISVDGDLLKLAAHEGIPVLTPAQFPQHLR